MTSRVSSGAVLGILYFLAGVWYAVGIVGLYHSKAFLGGIPLFWNLLFAFIPAGLAYGVIRIAFGDRGFIKRRPIVFFGIVVVALLPVCLFIFVILGSGGL